MPTLPDPPPSIALASLLIRDFRGIAHLELDFCGPDRLPNRLVVIGGPNGSGKTAVLEAAILLVDDTHLILGGIGKNDIRRGADHALIEGRVADSFAGNTQIVRRLSTVQSRLRSDSSFIPVWYFPSWRAPGLGGPVDVSMGRPNPLLRQDPLNRLRSTKQKLVNAAAVEKFSGNGSPASQQYSRWIEAINRAWNEFDPTGNASIHVELTDHGNPDAGSFDLYYCQPDQLRLEVDQLSSGQLELFLFLAELVFEGDRIGIVFIDEPELHLDPQWHRPFVRSLMHLQPKTQFIITTHSPEIFDAAYSYERHFLVPDDDPRARIWSEVRHDQVGA